TIDTTLKFVQQTRGETLVIQDVPFDDVKTFDLLARGETVGLFQLEGAAMTRHLTHLKPTSVADLAVMVALYRPGPMANIDEYVRMKDLPDEVTYLHPALEPILKETYGVMVYQDQVLLAARDLAGYTWPEIDVMRKAMGKKIAAELRIQRDKFIDGAVANDVERRTAEEIYSLIEPFGGYGFNKAHAFFYGTIAYWTAYLKANFPVEFMASVLITNSGDSGKIAAAFAECDGKGIEIVAPSISRSEAEFRIDGNQIVWGLAAVKNVGKTAMESIVATREQEPFTSLENFCQSVEGKVLNRRMVESLVKVGALDEMGERNALLEALGPAVERAQKLQRDGLAGHATLFDALDDVVGPSMEAELPDVPPASDDEKSAWEVELLGVKFSPDDFDRVWPRLKATLSMAPAEIGEEHNDQYVDTGGQIKQFRSFPTRRGAEMAAFVLHTPEGDVEVTVLPGAYDAHREKLVEDQVVALRVKAEVDDLTVRLLVDRQSSMQRFADPADYPEMGTPAVAEVARAVGSDGRVEPTVSANGAGEGAAEATVAESEGVDAPVEMTVSEEEVVEGPDEAVVEEEKVADAPVEMAAAEEEVVDASPAEMVAARAEVADATANGAPPEAAKTVRVVMRRSGNFGRDQGYLDHFNRVALEHAGGAEIFLLIADDEDAVELRWKLRVAPDATLVAAIEALDGSERVEVLKAGEGGRVR
ncbi:MAG TPA: hypothetical protein QGH28_03500, partial [Chloroflexota bacterium]|nr:hypothetical protein [Chloroflexota bacterium]